MLTAPSEATAADELDGPRLTTAELEVGGMHCSACATRIQRSLGNAPAMASASVNLATTRAFICHDAALVDTGQLCRAVHDAGSSAWPVTDAPGGDARNGGDHWVVRAAISWPLAIAALVVALVGPETPVTGWTVLILAVAVEIAGGWPFLQDSAHLLRHGATSMDTLIALGTVAAPAVSAVEAIAFGGRHLRLGAAAPSPPVSTA